MPQFFGPLSRSVNIISQHVRFNEAFPSLLPFSFCWGTESDNCDKGQLIFPRSHLPVTTSPSFVSIQNELGGGLPLPVTIHRVILAIPNFIFPRITWCLAFQSQDKVPLLSGGLCTWLGALPSNLSTVIIFDLLVSSDLCLHLVLATPFHGHTPGTATQLEQ